MSSNVQVSTEASWQEANARYLAAAVAWLRASMEQLATHQQGKQLSLALPPPHAEAPTEQRNSVWGFFARRHTALPATTPPLLLPSSDSATNQRSAEAAASM